MMVFTTPEGRTYYVSDALVADGGAGIVAAVVQLDRDGITEDGQTGDVIAAPLEVDDGRG